MELEIAAVLGGGDGSRALTEIRTSGRWAPWWLAVIGAAVLLGAAVVIFNSLLDPETWGGGIRLIIPAWLVTGYLVLAIVTNKRTIRVTPDGVCVRNRPFPIGSNRSADRAEIRCIYARHIVQYNEGSKVADFHTAGVETTEGVQIDLSAHHKEAEAAWHDAHRIASVLNASPSAEPIEVRAVTPVPNDREYRRQIFAWLSLYVIAILLGVLWEIAPVY